MSRHGQAAGCRFHHRAEIDAFDVALILAQIHLSSLTRFYDKGERYFTFELDEMSISNCALALLFD